MSAAASERPAGPLPCLKLSSSSHPLELSAESFSLKACAMNVTHAVQCSSFMETSSLLRRTIYQQFKGDGVELFPSEETPFETLSKRDVSVTLLSSSLSFHYKSLIPWALFIESMEKNEHRVRVQRLKPTDRPATIFDIPSMDPNGILPTVFFLHFIPITSVNRADPKNIYSVGISYQPSNPQPNGKAQALFYEAIKMAEKASLLKREAPPTVDCAIPLAKNCDPFFTMLNPPGWLYWGEKSAPPDASAAVGAVATVPSSAPQPKAPSSNKNLDAKEDPEPGNPLKAKK